MNYYKKKESDYNLTNFFKRYSLNEDQKKAVKELDFFLQNKNQYFILKGYAGTGKTFLMKGLTEYLTLIIYTIYF